MLDNLLEITLRDAQAACDTANFSERYKLSLIIEIYSGGGRLYEIFVERPPGLGKVVGSYATEQECLKRLNIIASTGYPF